MAIFQANVLKAATKAAKAFKLRIKVSTAKWIADNYRLPSVIGDLSGSYDFYYAPYFLGVAAALDDDEVVELVLMKAAQIGWTYFLIGYIAKRIATDPCPVLGVFAKEKDGKSFHDEKLVPAFQETTVIEDLIDITTTRKAGTRWDLKTFPGGFLKLVGSNSPGNVKSTSSVGVAIIEEPDDTSDDVKSQGNAIGLAEERLKRYVNAKLIVGGTPTIADLSKTEFRVKETDQRELPIECHDCGEKHVLDWDNVSWQDNPQAEPHEVYGYAQPETAIYCCPNCGSAWDDDQRQANIRNTVFKAVEAGDPLCGWVQTKPFHGKAGFQGLSELYACVPGTSLADVVRSKLSADYKADRGDIRDLVTFTNQRLGKTFVYENTAPDEDALRQRAEDYPEWFVPRGGLILTAGVDVQRDRLAVIVRAWGRGMESWLVYWGEIAAKTSTTDTSDPVWQDLFNLLDRPVPHESGARLKVQSVSIDSGDGYTTEQVYQFVRYRQRHGYRAIKGSTNDTGNREIYTAPRKIDFKNQTKASKFGLQVYQVGTHKAKDLIFGEGGRLSLEGEGPGRMHWYKDVRDDYYTQLQGIVKAPNIRRGGRLMWQDKPGHAIEAVDCEVYALHAAYSLRLNQWKDDKWDSFEAQLNQVDLFKTDEDDTPKQPARRKSSFWD